MRPGADTRSASCCRTFPSYPRRNRPSLSICCTSNGISIVGSGNEPGSWSGGDLALVAEVVSHAKPGPGTWSADTGSRSCCCPRGEPRRSARNVAGPGIVKSHIRGVGLEATVDHVHFRVDPDEGQIHTPGDSRHLPTHPRHPHGTAPIFSVARPPRASRVVRTGSGRT